VGDGRRLTLIASERCGNITMTEVQREQELELELELEPT
jgi:hypothetical protein